MNMRSFLVMSLSLAGIALFAEPASAVETLSQRVNKLEKKTDFYLRSVLKRGRKYTRRIRDEDKTCDDFVGVIIPLDLKNPAELKVWMSYAVQYDMGPKPVDIVLSTSIGDGVNTFGGQGCLNYRYDLVGSNKFKVEAYCSFSASAGDDMFAFVSLDKPPAGVCAPKVIAEFSALATINKIEMVKPK